jgi:hypothetical protein
LVGAQLNVVLKDRLYPRSLVKDGPQTDADRRVLQAYAAERTTDPEAQVVARVSSSARGGASGTSAGHGGG